MLVFRDCKMSDSSSVSKSTNGSQFESEYNHILGWDESMNTSHKIRTKSADIFKDWTKLTFSRTFD